MFRIGIDLGGTKIEGIALDADGVVVSRQRIATPSGEYDATLDAIVALIASLEREIGASATIGIGSPGAISPATGLLKNSNSTCLNFRPVQADIEARLRRPVRIANDANCFALSEAVDGAGRDAETVFGVILGTGVGGGVVRRGEAVIGANAIAGEWGHNAMAWPAPDELPGPPCYCGRNGCIETFLSGPGLSADLMRACGRELPAIAIADKAFRGDHDCEAALERYAERLARALANVINILDPDVIVLGGGLSKIGFLYERVPRLWPSYVFSEEIATRLLPPLHGDASGVRGAAWLWPST